LRLLARIAKPEYFFRPSQLFKGLLQSHPVDAPNVTTTLPWRAPLTVNPNEVHGQAILRLGVMDLPVTEAIWRLLDAGERAIDVGANIGYMTSIMAARVGVNGVVSAFEPYPVAFSRLERNVDRWNRSRQMGHTDALEAAVSCCEQIGALRLPDASINNDGHAALVRNRDDRTIAVKLLTLDGQVADQMQVGLLKVDVEGHELEVLTGARSLLERRGIRDIIFEEHRNYPTPVTDFLDQRGCSIYELGMTFWRPILGRCGKVAPMPRREWEPRSMLATFDPGRAERRFQPSGWFALRQSRTARTA